jgi:hypothetical protein
VDVVIHRLEQICLATLGFDAGSASNALGLEHAVGAIAGPFEVEAQTVSVLNDGGFEDPTLILPRHCA